MDFEEFVRGSGEKVRVYSFISEYYLNDDMDRLRKAYDFRSHPGFVGSSLGNANAESFVGKLFNFYKIVKTPCGLEEDSIKSLFYDERVKVSLDYVMQRDLLDRETISGVSVLFPNDRLMRNQKLRVFDGSLVKL